MNLTIDLNTIVGALALAAILYVARTVTQLDKRQAVAEQEAKEQDKYARETRGRLVRAEEEIGELKVNVGKLEAEVK